MSNIVVKVEDISKQYRLGQVGTGSLSHDINRWWHKVRGNEDPYLKIGEENDRTAKSGGANDYVWALKDINFTVNHGDVLGIIGRNGAGKSTLLKVLSRTTAPTTGSVKIKGRVASLLEVGTGFHPELSGRDNIFLNGAILGMTRNEIKRKFDEIVEFAGVERYVDTPVKRYSSGMYVRLAFAVAAHLEPEILIVDEVLAVGDAEFQKKALGKMKDVSEKDGRTVLFVSHNMTAMAALCTTGIVMKNGKLFFEGKIQEAINSYQNSGLGNKTKYEAKSTAKQDVINSIELALDGKEQIVPFMHDEHISIKLECTHRSQAPGTHIGIAILDKWRNKVFTDTFRISEQQLKKETTSMVITIPSKLLLTGTYFVDVALFVPNISNFDYVSEALMFEVTDLDSHLAILNDSEIGSVLVNCDWNLKN